MSRFISILKERFRREGLPAGKTSSSRSLCKYLEVSRSTVELAYEQLISEGYVEAVPCKGYFAAELEGMYRLDVVPALVGAEEKTEKKSGNIILHRTESI